MVFTEVTEIQSFINLVLRQSHAAIALAFFVAAAASTPAQSNYQKKIYVYEDVPVERYEQRVIYVRPQRFVSKNRRNYLEEKEKLSEYRDNESTTHNFDYKDSIALPCT